VTDRERVEHRVGGIDEFPAGTHKVVKVGRLREIGVFNIDGKLYALPNLCPHQTGPTIVGRGISSG
jgi:nitrite reductase/ring-hydroxylating ferredoxin subunit